jgi:4-hydroxybenzoate polyprenyltransferase
MARSYRLCFQEKSDDEAAVVKTITLILGQHIRTALDVFASTLIFSLFISGHLLSGNGFWYCLVCAGGGSHFLASDLVNTNLDDSTDCLRAVSTCYIYHA